MNEGWKREAPGDPLVLREFDWSDLGEIVEVYREARRSALCFPEEEVSERAMKALIKGERLWVAEMEGQVMGFVSVWEEDAFIHHLYVRPTEQSHGIGRALIEKCVQHFGTPLALKCDKANQRAEAFYRRNGWQVANEATDAEPRNWNRWVLR